MKEIIKDYLMLQGMPLDGLDEYIDSQPATTEIDLTNIINLDRSGMSALISDKIEQLSEGWIDEEQLFVYAKKLETFSELLVNAVKDKVDPTKFPKDHIVRGVKLESRMVGVKTDYSGCNYDPYEMASAALSSAKSQLKVHEDFLKSLTKPMTLVDEDSGEVVTVNPPVKSGKLSPVATVL